MISAKDLTVGRLRTALADGGIDHHLDSDGDIVAEFGGLKLFVKPEPEKELVKLFALLGTKPLATRGKMIDACNTFNDAMIMVRLSVPEGRSGVILADYDLLTAEGVTGEQVVTCVRRFTTVLLAGAVKHCSGVLK